MPAPATNNRLLPGLLDRLLDDEPGVSSEAGPQEGQVIRELNRSILRDLENLLNARRPLAVLPNETGLLAGSLANYGLPDLQSLEIREDHDVDRMCDLIRECIERFEPRLRGVYVKALGEGHAMDRRLRFVIEATLLVEPLQQEVRIESEIDASRAGFTVRTSS
jgi:type VI secretion system protein ImpF